MRTISRGFPFDRLTCRRRLAVPGIVALAVTVSALFSPALAQDRPVDAAATPQSLEIRRNASEDELRRIARAIAEANGKADQLEKSIAAIEKSKVALREAIIASAAGRKELEARIADHSRQIASLEKNQKTIRASLKERRGLLSEVLGALERMGRNPPPALLVTPDDALGSVRSAILLGAVVPGIRGETDKLAADLAALARVGHDLGKARENFVLAMAASLEESRRMDRLIIENERIAEKSGRDLAAERKKAADLASRATSLESLIASLERDIGSAKAAADAARAENDRRKALTPEEREAERKAVDDSVPDKNRIAPAYAFSDLKGKLDPPVAGRLIRGFGEDDGTGHQTVGLTLESGPGAIVTAPADGWIVFAGPFRSYGETVILNLGDGHHMVMTGMGSVLTRQGQFVVAGEPLGQMGEKRVASAAALALETDRPTLYIELRKDGEPVDSTPWWLVRTVGKAQNDS